MTHRLIMVSRMDPDSAVPVANLFAEHDKTDVPREIGLTARTLFHYQGMTMHCIESDSDIVNNILTAYDKPEFREINQSLRPYLSPLVDNWTSIADSQAHQFYHCSWPPES